MQIIAAVSKEKAQEIIKHHGLFSVHQPKPLWTYVELTELELAAIAETNGEYYGLVRQIIERSVINVVGASVMFLAKTVIIQKSVDTYEVARDKTGLSGPFSLLSTEGAVRDAIHS